MWRFASILLVGISLPTAAADMSVDQAVSRLLKDIETGADEDALVFSVSASL